MGLDGQGSSDLDAGGRCAGAATAAELSRQVWSCQGCRCRPHRPIKPARSPPSGLYSSVARLDCAHQVRRPARGTEGKPAAHPIRGRTCSAAHFAEFIAELGLGAWVQDGRRQLRCLGPCLSLRHALQQPGLQQPPIRLLGRSQQL